MNIRTKKIVKISVITIIAIILAYLLFVLLSMTAAILYSRYNIDIYKQMQAERIISLENGYNDGVLQKVDEQSFCDFDIFDDTIKYNEFRFLATHNSYKNGLNAASNVFYNYAVPYVAGGLYEYDFETVTEQLNMGIRSFELDISYIKDKKGDRIECLHNYSFETNSSFIDFELGLKELKMWSDYNPNHMPITILIEAKNSSILSKVKDMDEERLGVFDKMLDKVLGEKLLTPTEFLGMENDFDSLRKNNAYPLLNDMKGKFVFLYHDGKTMENYINIDSTFKTQKMIPILSNDKFIDGNAWTKYSCFTLQNTATNADAFAGLEGKNCIIRTRLDIYGIEDDNSYNSGLSSQANILSTDHPPRKDGKTEYVCILNNGKTMILKNK